jgi:hypothetical protein
MTHGILTTDEIRNIPHMSFNELYQKHYDISLFHIKMQRKILALAESPTYKRATQDCVPSSFMEAIVRVVESRITLAKGVYNTLSAEERNILFVCLGLFETEFQNLTDELKDNVIATHIVNRYF